MFDELTGIEVTAAIALVVNTLAIEHLRTALTVERGQTVIGEDVGENASHHFGDRGAARDHNDRLVLDHFVDRHSVGRVRLGSLDAAPGGAGAPADHSLGASSNVLDLVLEDFTARDAERAVAGERHIAFDREDVLTLVLRNGVFESRFSLFTGSCHDGVVVVERNHGEDDVLGDRVIRTDEGFGAAGALKTVKPDHRNAGFGLHRGSDILGAGAAEAEAGSGEGAELQEAPAAYTLTAKGLVLCFSHSYLL